MVRAGAMSVRAGAWGRLCAWPADPGALRAAAGLAALTIDDARKLPEQLAGLPVLAVSTAMQASLKVQQPYAGSGRPR